MKVMNRSFYSTLFMVISTSSLLGCVGPDCVSNKCNNVTPAKTGESYGNTHWLQRAQGEQLGIFTGVGVSDKINIFNACTTYGIFDITGLYESNVKPGHNASYFADQDGLLRIGAIGDPTITIRASDMGMSTTAYSAVYCMRPRIRNFVLSFDLYTGWDTFVAGLFSRVRIPLTLTKWDLGLTKAQEETVLPIDPLTNSNPFTEPPFYPVGFVDVATVGVEPVHTLPLLDGNLSFEGNIVPTSYYVSSIDPNAPLSTKTSQYPQLEHGMICGRLHKVGLADLPMDLGYNFIRCERGMMSLALHTVFPIGTKQDDDCIFSPRVGYGRWQVGPQVNAQYTFMQCDDRRFTMYFAGFVTYALGTTENRLLGLNANDGYHFNHYLLLKKFSVDGTLIALERAANLLYQPIKLSGFVNSDLAIWAQYQNGKFDFSVGWNFVGRQAEGFKDISGETVRHKGLVPVPNAHFGNDDIAFYVIKGDTLEYNNVDNTIALSGYNKNDSDIKVLGTLVDGTVDELKAIALTSADVIAGPALHDTMITNSFFFYLGYTWLQHPHVTPFIGIGGQFEDGHGNAAMDTWALFMKGGFAF